MFYGFLNDVVLKHLETFINLSSCKTFESKCREETLLGICPKYTPLNSYAHSEVNRIIRLTFLKYTVIILLMLQKTLNVIIYNIPLLHFIQFPNEISIESNYDYSLLVNITLHHII